MRIGVRAHDFGKLPVEQLARRISEKGFKSIQLALPKAIDGISTDLGNINSGMAYHIRETFYKENIQIAVMGCYINPIHPDKKERRRSIERFKEHLSFVREFGCSLVATETGSINADCSYHKDNESEECFQQLLETVKELVMEAEKFGVFVGIEGVTSHVITTPQRMKRLLDAVPSNNIQIVFDPVNYICDHNYEKQEEIIKDAFELFGDKIAIVHLKDFIVKDGKVVRVPPGEGILNYDLLLKYINERKPYVNCLLEEIEEKHMEKCKKFIEEIG